jgi:hypothetical protein
MKSNAFWGIALLILIIAGVAVWAFVGEPVLAPTLATSTPQQNGGDTSQSTVDQLKARVVIDAPKSGAQVPKTFTVTGKAPGPWYFEASFGIEVRGAGGELLVQTYASALSDWMTIDDVPFKADISVPNYTGPATLILNRDNPSGLPENDASVSIPIVIQ